LWKEVKALRFSINTHLLPLSYSKVLDSFLP
jgi:hypothetical protein